jgi:peptidoglycan hydrolase-like protein with peptidoglycan-binding domain
VISDIQATAYATQALRMTFVDDPSVGEICALDAVALLETSRGDGWRGAGVGSYNMGAIQCGSSWIGAKFSYVDTHPNSDGTSTQYRVDFRRYPTRLAGLMDLTKVMYIQHGRQAVRDAARARDWMGVSRELHISAYYEGFGSTVEQRIANHNRALMRGITRDLAAMGEVPQPVVRPALVVPETVRRGDSPRNGKGSAVAELQRELQLAADGIFGKCTEQVLIEYQRARGLTVDGICGPATWTALLTDEFVPEAA